MNFPFKLFALVITAVYSNISFDSHSMVQDISGYLIILSTEVLFCFIYAVFFLVYEVLPLLRKETGDRLYSFSAYYVSLVLLMVVPSRTVYAPNITLCSISDSARYFRDVPVHRDHLFLNGYRSRHFHLLKHLPNRHLERNMRHGLWVLPVRAI